MKFNPYLAEVESSTCSELLRCKTKADVFVVLEAHESKLSAMMCQKLITRKAAQQSILFFAQEASKLDVV